MEQLSASNFDVAVVDINLRDQATYPVADELMRREIPFVFTTGYSAEALPARFRDAPRREKPYDTRELVDDVRRLCRLRALVG